MKRQPAAYAFTLTELVVIIAIIAVLSGILFPVYAQTRVRAKTEACLANERQIGLAIVQYEQDYDGKAPGGLNGKGGGSGYAGQIYPFVNSTNAFLCPSDSGSTVSGIPANGHWRASSLAINSNTSLPNPIHQTCQDHGDSLPVSKYTQPANTVLLFEVTNSTNYNVDTETNTLTSTPSGTASTCGGSPSGNGLGGPYLPNGYNGQNGAGKSNDGFVKYATGVTAGNLIDQGSFISFEGRHQGGANYVLADGHARWLLPSDVSAGLNADAPTDAAADHTADPPTHMTDGRTANGVAAGTSGTLSDKSTRPSVTFSVI